MTDGGFGRRTALVVLLAAAPLAVAGCGGSGSDAVSAGAQAGPGGPGGGRPGGGGGPGGMGGPGGAGGARTVNVEVGVVERGRIAREVTVSGVVEPIRSVSVNSQLGGAVLAVQVEEGDRVAQGAVLARLDDRELRAQLAAAEASFQVAEAAYQRAEQLRERRVITLPEYERERTAYAAALSQRDQIRTRIGFATITSPINGVVTEKSAERGDIVGNNARIFTIADVSEMVVRVGVSEMDVVALSVGETVRVALDAYPGQELVARIRRVFPSADPTTRLVPVEVALSGPAASLARPGFLARITFGVGAREGVLLVPAGAVLPTTAGPAVFVVSDGRAVRRIVETGATSAGRVEIISGLQDGDPIVVVGSNMLRDGSVVRVVGAGAADAPVVAPREGGVR
jgi:membrane fusion protein, multidrug efflux system